LIGRNFTVKNAKTFLNTMQKFRLKISYRYREILKNEMISFSYDVNDQIKFCSTL